MKYEKRHLMIIETYLQSISIDHLLFQLGLTKKEKVEKIINQWIANDQCVIMSSKMNIDD